MSTHPGVLVAYTDDGDIIFTLAHKVVYDDDGRPLGLVDFAAHEEAGGEMTDIWTVEDNQLTVKGSKVWPEYLGGAFHHFKVELDGPAGRKKIKALVHKESGHRRERADVEAAIQARIDEAQGAPADIRDLVGGPDRPLHIDETGKTRPKPERDPKEKKLPLRKVK